MEKKHDGFKDSDARQGTGPSDTPFPTPEVRAREDLSSLVRAIELQAEAIARIVAVLTAPPAVITEGSKRPPVHTIFRGSEGW